MMSNDIIKEENIKQENDSNKSKLFASSKPGGPKLTDAQKKEEQMKQRAKNFSQQAIKQIIDMDLPKLKKVVNTGACNLPVKYLKDIPNAFIRYLYEKELLQVNQKGKTTAEKAQLREENKHLYAFDEYSWLFKKLMSGEFEDSWIDSEDLPALPLIEKPNLMPHCLHIFNFLKSYRHVLKISKFPGVFEFIDALKNGKDGFLDVTCRLLKLISVFIHKNRKTIPDFRIGRVEAQMLDAKSISSVHYLARRILNPSYQMEVGSESEHEGSDSDQSDEIMSGRGKAEQPKHKAIEYDEMEVEEESMLDEEEVSERFCEKYIYDLSPMEQVYIFELLLERVEVSGPIMDSIKESDVDLKKLKANMVNKRVELNDVKNQLKEFPPIIPKEEYESGPRHEAIEIVKKNRKREAFENEKNEIEKELSTMRKDIEEIQSGLRLRASPIGYDRFYRGYWMFPSTPGLIVEQGALTTETPDENGPLVLPPMGNPQPTMSTAELIKFLHTLLNGGCPSPTAPIKWFHVNSKELLDELLKKLSNEGVRESHLKESIKHHKAEIEASFDNSA